MKKTRKQYSSDEDRVILEQIDLYPDNKLEAFRRASDILPNRTFSSISVRYYNYLFENRNDFNTSVGSINGFTRDRKNSPVKSGETFKRKETLAPVIVVMQQMLSLGSKEREAIINFLQSIK